MQGTVFGVAPPRHGSRAPTPGDLPRPDRLLHRPLVRTALPRADLQAGPARGPLRQEGPGQGSARRPRQPRLRDRAGGRAALDPHGSGGAHLPAHRTLAPAQAAGLSVRRRRGSRRGGPRDPAGGGAPPTRSPPSRRGVPDRAFSGAARRRGGGPPPIRFRGLPRAAGRPRPQAAAAGPRARTSARPSRRAGGAAGARAAVYAHLRPRARLVRDSVGSRARGTHEPPPAGRRRLRQDDRGADGALDCRGGRLSGAAHGADRDPGRAALPDAAGPRRAARAHRRMALRRPATARAPGRAGGPPQRRRRHRRGNARPHPGGGGAPAARPGRGRRAAPLRRPPARLAPRQGGAPPRARHDGDAHPPDARADPLRRPRRLRARPAASRRVADPDALAPRARAGEDLRASGTSSEAAARRMSSARWSRRRRRATSRRRRRWPSAFRRGPSGNSGSA